MRGFSILAFLVLLSDQIQSSSGMDHLQGKFAGKNCKPWPDFPSGSGGITSEIAAGEKWQPADLPEGDSRWYARLIGDRTETIKWLKSCGSELEENPQLYPHLLNEIPFLKELKETFLKVREGKEDLQQLYMRLEVCMKILKTRDLTTQKGNEAVATFFAMLALITEAGNGLDEHISKTSQEVRKWLKRPNPLDDDLSQIISKHQTFEKLNDALIMLWYHLTPIKLPNWFRSMI